MPIFSHIIKPENLLAAFQCVKENQGMAGVDGVTIARFEEDLDGNLAFLEEEIRRGIYAPLPLLKILVAKPNGEPRALCIPAVRDRVAQAAVLNVIGPVLEKEFEDCSFAYRKGRSVKQAVYRIKEYFDDGYRWVVDADVDAFFDSVNHNLLLAKVEKFIPDEGISRLIRLWIKGEIWDGQSIKLMDKGLPQGSPISPVLANLFLDEFDEALLKKGYKAIRYGDDFIILCKSPEKARDALEFSTKTLEKLLLKLDESDIVSFDEGFKYLGVIFVRSMAMVPFERQKKEKKVLYFPPPLNLEEYLSRRRVSFPIPNPDSRS